MEVLLRLTHYSEALLTALLIRLVRDSARTMRLPPDGVTAVRLCEGRSGPLMFARLSSSARSRECPQCPEGGVS